MRGGGRGRVVGGGGRVVRGGEKREEEGGHSQVRASRKEQLP